MHIGHKQIGDPSHLYFIAELGVNHDGSVDRALELVDAAKHAGCDAIKLQLFETDRLMSKSAKLAAYQKAAGETDPLAMLRRLELSIDQMRPIVDHAHGLNMHAIVTVFSTELVAEAERLPFDAYKTASSDIVHKPLLDALAATGKPLIVSTGASTLDEVSRAIEWLSMAGANDRLALLQCVSCYPTAPEDASIAGMCALARIFDGPIGYSDHTPDEDTSAIAFQLGAAVLEKHLAYDRTAQGPDHAASLDPRGMVEYVLHVRDGERDVTRVPRDMPELPSLIARDPRVGAPEKRVLECEKDVRAVSRQSLIATRTLPAGHVLTAADITCKRPGTGLVPFEMVRVLGKPLRRAVKADTVIAREDIA